MVNFDHLVFDAHALDTRQAARTLNEFKCIQIKGALDTERLEPIRRRALASRLAKWGAGQPLAILETEGTRPSFEIVRAFRRSPATKVLRRYFASDTLLLTAQHSRYRQVRMEADYEQLPFHQDGSALPEIPNVTCSALIYPDVAGEQVAGLQFIPGATDEILPRATPEPGSTQFYDFLRIDPAVLEVCKKQGVWVPRFEYGDVILFDRCCIHGTYWTDRMEGARISVDLRVWPYSPEVYAWPDFRWFVDHPRFLYGPTRLRQSLGDLPDEQFFARVQAAPYDYGLIETGRFGRLAFARRRTQLESTPPQ